MTTEPEELRSALERSWGRFLDVYEPLRPELYRYCRHLTRSPWDAEDLAQDTLARAYATLACMAAPPPSPRAWLLRVASNLWLNRVRAARETPSTLEGHEPAVAAPQRETREAVGTLVSRLSPQERAALVLKDVFELSLEEVASTLSTSAGAIKAALHRGRTKLVEPEVAEPTPVVPAALDAFCAAFDARDLDRLTALLLDDAVLEFPGVHIENGALTIRESALKNTLFGCAEAGYVVTTPPRSEVRFHRGEPVLLWWKDGKVDAVVRVTLDGERVRALTNYRHSPELTAEVCAELDVSFTIHGHRPQRSRHS